MKNKVIYLLLAVFLCLAPRLRASSFVKEDFEAWNIAEKAIENNNLEALKKAVESRPLIAKNPNPNYGEGYTLLYAAAGKGDNPIINYLYTLAPALIDVPYLGINGAGTPLMVAAQEGHFEAVKNLLAKGASIKISVNGKSALSLAAQYDHEPIAIYLLQQKGSDSLINDRDNSWEYTPLHWAAEKGRLNLVKLLEAEAKKTVSTISLNDMYTQLAKTIITETTKPPTPLHLAVANGHRAVVQELIESNPGDINKIEINGATPLHYAALMGHIDIMKDLIKAGADTTVVCRKIAKLVDLPGGKSILLSPHGGGGTALQIAEKLKQFPPPELPQLSVANNAIIDLLKAPEKIKELVEEGKKEASKKKPPAEPTKPEPPTIPLDPTAQNEQLQKLSDALKALRK